ncbi:MAG TPA: glycosyltransferase family 4 protein [Gaiellaceae bacterium]|nr:glycosyltransferase family 4 protein [Gaiellaceae bacterium]
MKVGIVVPYSWSFWGGVVEHAQEQAAALMELGLDVRLLIGHDPPGPLSRALHPTAGRFDLPPPHVIPLGRSVITPANGSLANIVLSPSALRRLERTLERESFDLLHIHEPLTPAIGVAALARATTPIVATFHAAGASRWRRVSLPLWGFLLDRIDVRIAVSPAALATANAYSPGHYRLLPNGVRLPQGVQLGGRSDNVVFVGRHERRKGLAVLLRAWPKVHSATGARLRIVGADLLAVRHLLHRNRLPATGIDLLGVIPSAQLDAELARAKLLAAPSLGSESFGMVLTRAFAAGTPVVASDIDGYRQVVRDHAGRLVPPGDPDALARAMTDLLLDETSRRNLASSARTIAERDYAWPKLARTLQQLYIQQLDASAQSAPGTGTRTDARLRRSPKPAKEPR